MESNRNVVEVIDLGADEARRIESARGTVVTVLTGHLWLTQEGDDLDRVLGAGDEYALDREGVAVIQALDAPALVRLDGAPGGRRRELERRTPTSSILASISATGRALTSAARRAAVRSTRTGLHSL
jgi:hypothetical protein